jgi:hypothetical protein
VSRMTKAANAKAHSFNYPQDWGGIGGVVGSREVVTVVQRT